MNVGNMVTNFRDNMRSRKMKREASLASQIDILKKRKMDVDRASNLRLAKYEAKKELFDSKLNRIGSSIKEKTAYGVKAVVLVQKGLKKIDENKKKSENEGTTFLPSGKDHPLFR